MPRGRPPKPETVAWLEGNRRRAYRLEPPPPEGRPAPPPWLNDPVAIAEWEFTCDVLAEMGVMSRADRVALALYCDAVGRYVAAKEMMLKLGGQYGCCLPSKKGNVYLSPYHGAMRLALRDIITFSDRFGLSPVARARLSIEASNDPSAAKWADLIA